MSVMAGRARAHAEIARMLTFRVKDAPSEIGPDGFPVPGAPPSTPLRFPVGATVLCHVQRWERAVIVKHWYREANWETGKLVLPQPCARFVFTCALLSQVRTLPSSSAVEQHSGVRAAGQHSLHPPLLLRNATGAHARTLCHVLALIISRTRINKCIFVVYLATARCDAA